MKQPYTTILILVAFLAVSGIANAGGEFRASLTGKEEVPPVETDTTGKARIKFNDDKTAAAFRLKVRDGMRVTQAHIHCAPRGVNGPIVAFLAGFHALGWDIDGKWINFATLTDANILAAATPSATCPNTIRNLGDLAQAIRDGNTYVNVHTVANPPGEVRGQLE